MESTEWVLENAKSDPNLAEAVGVNMLMMMGTTMGGYLLAKGAVVAQKHIADVSDDGFYSNKISVAQFYAEQILPRALAYATSIKSGHVAVMSLSTDSF